MNYHLLRLASIIQPLPTLSYHLQILHQPGTSWHQPPGPDLVGAEVAEELVQLQVRS